MTKRVLMSCLMALGFCSQADAVTFVNAQFDVTAIAEVADGPAGVDAQSGSALTTPLVASTSSIGSTDIATAGAVGGLGVLTSSADVSASSGIASATATSHVSAPFVNTGRLALSVDFTPFSFAAGTGLATTSLFVLLTSNGVTLFQDFILGSQAFSYAAVAGTTGLLDLTLTSDVSAGFLMQGSGDASSFGQVVYASAVPEPATWLLFTAGFGGLLVAVRSRRSQPTLKA